MALICFDQLFFAIYDDFEYLPKSNHLRLCDMFRVSCHRCRYILHNSILGHKSKLRKEETKLVMLNKSSVLAKLHTVISSEKKEKNL